MSRRAPPVSESAICTSPPWTRTRPLTMYMPRPVPPRTPCFQNLVNTRARIVLGDALALVVDPDQHARERVGDRAPH